MGLEDDNAPKILGIDPGQTGAMAFLTPDGSLVAIEDLPYLGKDLNAYMFANLVVGLGPVSIAIVERAQTMPKQGIAGAFNYGTAYGKMLGSLATLNIPIIDYPTSWKTRAKLGKDKTLSRKRATQRWPHHSEFFHLVKYDGRAEAALMAAQWMEENPTAPALRGQRRRVIRIRNTDS